MAKFMDVHSGFVGVTEDQLREAHEHDLAIEASEGVHFERAWLDPEIGQGVLPVVWPIEGGSAPGPRQGGTQASAHYNALPRFHTRGSATAAPPA